jgi:hypothetical protein
MYAKFLLGVAGRPVVRSLMNQSSLNEKVVARFVAGESTASALAAVRRLVGEGLQVTLDHLGEDITEAAQAEATVEAYRELVEALASEGLTDGVEVSVKLSALGQRLGPDGPRASTDRARKLVEHASRHGVDVTFDMEDHTTVDHTLATVRELREDFPRVGCVLQAMLLRTEADARALAHPGAADLLAGPWRATLNAATMLGQSKTAHQAEIDAACELIDFWRFNVALHARIYAEQPSPRPGMWNRMEYRPLEGFVFASRRSTSPRSAATCRPRRR